MTMGALIAAWAKLGAVGVVMAAGIANAAEIKVIGSPGTREPYTLLVPAFEKATGHKVMTTWGGVNAVAKRVADGEVADVVMLPAPQIDDLIKAGKLAAETRVNVAWRPPASAWQFAPVLRKSTRAHRMASARRCWPPRRLRIRQARVAFTSSASSRNGA